MKTSLAQKLLAREFNKTAAAAREAFPERLERLTVLLVPTSDTPVYVAPSVADELSKNMAAVKEAVVQRSDYLQKNNALGLADRNAYIAETKVDLIALRDDMPGIFYPGYTQEMYALYVLDHELGHHVTEKGAGWLYSGQMRESSADAYATLRHVQRYGDNTPFLHTRVDRKAASIVLYGVATHYTSDTLEAVNSYVQKNDVSKLSLQEIAVAAQKIADQAHLDDNTLIKISKAYRPVKEACAADIGEPSAVAGKFFAQDDYAYHLFCRETLSVMRNRAGDPDIFKAGKRFLSCTSVQAFMQEQAKDNVFYQDALAFIKKDPSLRNRSDTSFRPPLRW